MNRNAAGPILLHDLRAYGRRKLDGASGHRAAVLGGGGPGHGRTVSPGLKPYCTLNTFGTICDFYTLNSISKVKFSSKSFCFWFFFTHDSPVREI